MDFDLTEEQRLLKESVDGLLTDGYDFDQRKKYAKEKGGWSKAFWGKLAEQGLLGLPFAEEDGGFGAGGREERLGSVVRREIAGWLEGGGECGDIFRAERLYRCAWQDCTSLLCG